MLFCLDFLEKNRYNIKCIGVSKNIASPHNSNYVVAEKKLNDDPFGFLDWGLNRQ